MKSIVALIAFVLIGGCTFSQVPTPTAAPGPDTWHMGRWFTNSSGQVVLFHGVNMVDKQVPYYPAAEGFGASDISLIQSMGLNLVRLGVIFAGVMPSPGQVNTNYIDQLVSQVNQLSKAGIYVILDFHQDEYSSSIISSADGFPAWATLTDGMPNHDYGFPANYLFNAAVNAAFDNFWNNTTVPSGPGTPWGDGLQNYYQQGLAAVASAFASNTDVLGYEIMNEPWPGSVYPSCLNPSTGCPGFDNGPYLSFIHRSITAIRSVDPDHLIFYEPTSLFNVGIPTNLGYVGDYGTGFAFHVYPICSQDNGGITNGQVNSSCGPQEEAVFANALAQQARSGSALILTEWGNSLSDAFDNQEALEADNAMVSWAYWSFDGSVVPNIANTLTSGNVNQNVVDDLARPYPMTTDGTPTEWNFSPNDKIFTLEYSTSCANGCTSFAAGQYTQISLPKLIYPTGYKVSLSGATIVSNANAPVLQLKNNPGATKVSVEISQSNP